MWEVTREWAQGFPDCAIHSMTLLQNSHLTQKANCVVCNMYNINKPPTQTVFLVILLYTCWFPPQLEGTQGETEIEQSSSKKSEHLMPIDLT